MSVTARRCSGCETKTMKTWSRNQKISVWAIVVPALMVLLSLVSSDVRRLLGLEKNVPAMMVTQTVVVPPPSSDPTPPQNPEPMQTPPKVSQHASTHVKGSGNVAGNNV